MTMLADEGRLTYSPWFDAATQPPMRRGWYEVHSIGWPEITRGYWCDATWHAWEPACPGDGLFYLGSYDGDCWRGVMAPEAQVNQPMGRL